MNMKYKDLLEQLKELTDKQLEMDVVVFDDGAGEWYTIDDARVVYADESDNLPYSCPYLFLGSPAPNDYSLENDDDI